MTAYPPEALAAVSLAIHRAACPLRDDPDHDCARDAALEELVIPRARAALDAAAPLLAEAVAQAILAHAERQHPRDPEHIPTAWHRHFSIAARVAAGAFDTREDQLRMAAEAIGRGDFIACGIPEVPRDVREDGIHLDREDVARLLEGARERLGDELHQDSRAAIENRLRRAAR